MGLTLVGTPEAVRCLFILLKGGLRIPQPVLCGECCSQCEPVESGLFRNEGQWALGCWWG